MGDELFVKIESMALSFEMDVTSISAIKIMSPSARIGCREANKFSESLFKSSSSMAKEKNFSIVLWRKKRKNREIEEEVE